MEFPATIFKHPKSQQHCAKHLPKFGSPTAISAKILAVESSIAMCAKILNVIKNHQKLNSSVQKFLP